MSYTLEDFFARVRCFGASVDPSGSKFTFACNLSGIPQVWISEVPAKGLIPFPKQLTHDENIRPNIWSPCLKWLNERLLLITFDFQGDEQTRLVILDTATGRQTPIPWEKGNRDAFGVLDYDQKNIFFSSNRGNPKRMQLYRYNMKSAKVKLVVGSDRYSLEWTPFATKKRLFYLEVISNSQTKLWQYTIKTGQTKVLFNQKNTLINVIAELSTDTLLVNTNHQRQFQSPGILHLKTGEISYLFKDKWDRIGYLSPDKKNLLIDLNRSGCSELQHYTFPKLARKKLTFANDGMVFQIGFTKDSSAAIVGYLSSTRPLDYWKVQLKNNSTPHQLTRCYSSPVPQRDLIKPKIVAIKSGTDRVSALFFLPRQAATKPVPAIIWPHGGPQAQERPIQRPMFQYMLSEGYAILAPNPRGSTGFGKDWQMAIERSWGEADLPDMSAAIAYLKNHKSIDPEKLIVMGGSYGGFMTLRSATKFPDTFKAAVDLFGPADLLSFVQSVPKDWQEYTNTLVGHPVKDKDQLRRQSPYYDLDQLKCPIFIVQGALDPRVVKAESDKVVERLRTKGHQVEYLVFEDEGHGFFKHQNEVRCFREIAAFIGKHVAPN